MLGSVLLGWLSAMAVMAAMIACSIGLWETVAAYTLTGIVVTVSAAGWSGFRDEVLPSKTIRGLEAKRRRTKSVN